MKSERTGKPVPLDAVPTEAGTVLMKAVEIEHGAGAAEGVAHFTTKRERDNLRRMHALSRERMRLAPAPFVLYVEHHVTCPAAARVDAGELHGQNALF